MNKEEQQWKKPTDRPLGDDLDAFKSIQQPIGKRESNKRPSEHYEYPGMDKFRKSEQKSHEAYFAEAPMYSSFTKDGLFPS